jgi:hypothetical protein
MHGVAFDHESASIYNITIITVLLCFCSIYILIYRSIMMKLSKLYNKKKYVHNEI